MTTQTEALKLALEAFKKIRNDRYSHWEVDKEIDAIKEALAQPEQEPVAIKFKIYKPTAPDPMRQDINDALLPWVYDQSRGSGFVASMWVTPVATLPPQRTWVGLTEEERTDICEGYGANIHWRAFRAIEAKLKEKNT